MDGFFSAILLNFSIAVYGFLLVSFVSIFVTTLNFLKTQKNVVFGGKMKGYLIDEKSSFDIDTPLDFIICDFLLKEN